jgi:hypothetical protein
MAQQVHCRGQRSAMNFESMEEMECRHLSLMEQGGVFVFVGSWLHTRARRKRVTAARGDMKVPIVRSNVRMARQFSRRIAAAQITLHR